MCCMRWGWSRMGLATILLATLTGAFAVVWWLRGESDAVAVATVAAAVLTVAVPLISWAVGRSQGAHDAADDVDRVVAQLAHAVRRQWEREADLRQLRDPQPLSVRWSEAASHLMDHMEVVVPEPRRRRLNRRLAVTRLSLIGSVDRVVQQFRALPRRRLVVIGMPGAGKTGVLVQLTLALSSDRHAADRVPVLLTPSSWEPLSQPFMDWLTVHLADQYPFLGRDGARAVVDGGRVLPLIDGLDELPAERLATALMAINRAGVQQPLIVACRTVEFAQAVHEGDVVTGAAVIELEPVAPEHVCDYLRLTTPRDDRAARWEPVFAQLRHEGGGPLVEALSTPLMVSLVRAVYALDRAADPGELTDGTRFPTRAAIEEHLLDRLVETTFRANRDRPAPGVHPWNPEQARRWLVFLARHLHRRDTRDLAWWHLYSVLPLRVRAPVVAALGVAGFAVVGALLGVLVGALLHLLGRTGPVPSVGRSPLTGSILGVAFGLAAGVLAGTTPVGDPVQATLRARGRAGVRSILSGLGTGTWSGLAFGLLFGVAAAVASGVEERAVLSEVGWTLSALVFGLLFGVAAGLGFGLLRSVQAPVEGSLGAGPRSTRRGDGLVALALGMGGGAALGITFGVLLALLLAAPLTITVDASGLSAPIVDVVTGIADFLAGSRDEQLITGITAGFAFGAVFAIGATLLGGLPPAASRVGTASRGRRWTISCLRALAFALLCGPVAGLALGLPQRGAFGLGLLYGLQGAIAYALVDWLMGGTARAWPAYTATVAWLGLRGRIPWRLMTFLEDAHRLGVLRQVGAVYQFRHGRLQDRLAGVERA